MSKDTGCGMVRLLTLLLFAAACLAIAMAVSVSSCLADDGSDVRIGNVYYDTLQEALDACDTDQVQDGSTIVLLKDINAETPLSAPDGINKIYVTCKTDKDITFDLNGHKIQTTEDMILIDIPLFTKLTIIDSSAAQSGEIINNGDRAAICVTAFGEFVLNSGKISGSGGSFNELIDGNTGYITINGGTIEGKNPIDVCGSSRVIINGGTITAVDSGNVIDAETSTIKINGGTINGGKSSTGFALETIILHGGSLDIKKGTINSCGNAIMLLKYQYNNNSEPKPSSGTMSGGTIEAVGTGVIMSQGSSFEMSGGIINGATGVNARYSAKLTLNDGSISGTSEAVKVESDEGYDTSALISSATLTGTQNGNALVLQGNSTAQIYRGTFKADNGTGLSVQDSASCELELTRDASGFARNSGADIDAETCISVNGTSQDDPVSVTINGVTANGGTAVSMTGYYEVIINDGLFEGDTLFSAEGSGKATVNGGSYQKDISSLIGADEHFVFDEKAETYPLKTKILMDHFTMPESYFVIDYYRLTKMALQYGPEVTEDEANCITPAHKACYGCSGCGRFFENPDHTGELTFEEVYGVEDPSQVVLGPHDLQYVEEVPAGCETTGMEAHYECKFCKSWFNLNDETGSQPWARNLFIISAHGHDYGAWTYLDENQHQRVCSHDPSHTETADHIWNWADGVVTKEATVTEEGIMTYTCTECGATYSEPIPKLDPSDPGTGGSGNDSGSGDSGTGGSGTDNGSGTVDSGTGTGTGTSTGTAADDEPLAPAVAPTLTATEAAIKSISNDGDVKGARFSPLKLRSTKQAKKNVTLKWTKVKGAKQYIIYGNKCGKKNKFKKLKTVSGTKASVKITKLKKKTYNKFIIVAVADYNGTPKVIASSKTIHVATKGGKIGNYKSVKCKNVKKSAVKLKKGKTFKIKTKLIKQSKKKVKKHRKLGFESSNTKIATVTSKGKIKAKAKGKCYVYVYAQNGVYKRIKVTVK